MTRSDGPIMMLSYLFGTIGSIVFVGSVAPKLLGVDLRPVARDLELVIGKDEDAITVPYARVVVRAHQAADNSAANGQRIADIEKCTSR